MLRILMAHLRADTTNGVHLVQKIQFKINALKKEFHNNEQYMDLIGPNGSEYEVMLERQQQIEEDLEELNDILWEEQSEDYHTNF